MRLHRQNFIEALSVLSATNDQIEISSTTAGTAMLRTLYTEITLRTQSVNEREFAVLFSPIAHTYFKKFCAMLKAIQTEYIDIDFIYNADEDTSVIKFTTETLKAQLTSLAPSMQHKPITIDGATELFTVTDEIYAAITTAKEFCTYNGAITFHDNLMLGTNNSIGFMYPVEFYSGITFELPVEVVNPYLKGSKFYSRGKEIIIVSRNTKFRIPDATTIWGAKIERMQEVKATDKTTQQIDYSDLRMSVKIAQALQSEYVGIAMDEYASVDMYSEDATGRTTVRSSGQSAAVEVQTAYAEQVLSSPFFSAGDRLTANVHTGIVHITNKKAEFFISSKSYAENKRDVVGKFVNGDDSITLGWSNPYELFRNEHRPWIEVRNEELKKQREAEDREIIKGLRSKLVNMDKAREVKQQQEEYAALIQEMTDLIDHRSSYEPKSAETLGAELSALEKQNDEEKLKELARQVELNDREESKERSAALKSIKADQAARNAAIKLVRDRYRQVVADEKRIHKLKKQTTDINSKISPLTFIRSNSLEEIEAHNQAIEEQIQEILCRP